MMEGTTVFFKKQGKRYKIIFFLLAVLSVILALLITVTAVGAGVIMRVSTDSAGQQVYYHNSDDVSISADGRFVAFRCYSSSLVLEDTNHVDDIFVKDTLTGATTRISTNSAGEQGNSNSLGPSISADGRYVAFCSYASNMVAGDTNGSGDIFLKDTQNGTIIRVSTDSAGGQVNGFKKSAAISANGRYVAFASDSPNLVPGDTNGSYDVFLKDSLTGAITRVSTDSAGGQVNYGGEYPAISADGRYVAFSSKASNLVPGSANQCYSPPANYDGVIVPGYYYNCENVFVKDTQTGITTRVSTDTAGQQGNNNSLTGRDSTITVISADGRYVAFDSYATNLVPGDTNLMIDVFVKDNLTGAITRVSTDAAGGQGNHASYNASISAYGGLVSFSSQASNLVPGDTNGFKDVFVKDTSTGAIARVSTDLAGGQGNNSSSSFSTISADGRYVAFESFATNLVPGDTNRVADVFMAVNPLAAPPECMGAKPTLSLSKENVHWASYADYTARSLSVDYTISNIGSDSAYNFSITGSPATDEVTLGTATPVSLGSFLPAGSAVTTTLAYNIPPGVASYRVTVNVSAQDACGATYTYP